MLLEIYDGDLAPRTLQLLFGLGLGAIFGVAAQISRFCLRRVVVSGSPDSGQAGAVWVTAFATALSGYQVGKSLGFIDIGDHRYLSPDLPVLAVLLGGLAFGAGMVLTRGCVSRLSVLSATGNIRAAAVLVVFAIVAHGTLKGVLAPLRMALGSVTWELPIATIGDLPLGIAASLTMALMAAALLIYLFRPAWQHILLGAVIGLTPVAGWAATSTLLFDEFDPLTIQSAAFTLPWSDTLFWIIASSALPAGFGTGLVAGVLAGSFVSAAFRKELSLTSFESTTQLGRYVLGAALMGVGGVLAGGCTVGAGLSGSATLSIAALLALVSIVAGGYATSRLLSSTPIAVPT